MNVLQIVSGYQKQALYPELFSKLELLGVTNCIYSQINKGETIPKECLEKKGLVFSKGYGKIERFSFFLKQRNMFAHIQRAYKLNSIDVIHAHTLFSSGYAAFRLKKEYGVPYIVTIRGADVNFFFKYYYPLRSLGIRIMEEASKIVFLSEGIKRIVFSKYIPDCKQNIFEEKSIVIPNGISQLFFDNIGTPKVLRNNKTIRFILVANINENKNLEGVIKTCRALQLEEYNIKLCIVGAIRDPKYEKTIKENDDLIEYHQKSPQSEVLKLMRESDIFLMPSHSETFGLVYAEAMSQGLPVLYTNGQGFDKQFEDGVVGFPVDDRDVADIVAAVKQIVDNYAVISSNCVKLVSRFNWQDISKEYFELYKVSLS